jgi:ribosomal protein S1
MQLTGTVTRLELYGAFIDIGASTKAILHVSKLGKRVNRVEDALSVGESVSVWIEAIDTERGQVTVSMVEPLAVDWSDLKVGQVYTGTVARLERFGAFVDIGAEKEGLVHISELSHEYVKHPSEAVKPGEEISVVILGFSKRKRRIDLSRKALLEQRDKTPQAIAIVDVDEEEEEEILPTAMEIALRRAMGQPESAVVRTSRRRTGRKSSPRRRGKRKRKLQEDILNRTLNLSKNLED